MERTQVADFYRGKGYQVHESMVVTGLSGNQQRVPLLCEGPMGNLAVFFGDAAGIDSQEIGAAKRVARDLGATAVVAAGTFTSEQRRAALELGVVLLDADAVETPAVAGVPSAWPGQTRAERLDRDLEAHPWPMSGRVGGEAAPSGTLALDIDQVGERPPHTPTAPTVEEPPVAAAPTPRAQHAPEGNLWKHARGAPKAFVETPARRGAQSEGRFAWLDLPEPAAATAEAEYTGSVAARAAPVPEVPLTPEELAARRQAELYRQVQLRVLVRRGAWILGAALVVYLFLLWWL